jgi:hypothetical protein
MIVGLVVVAAAPSGASAFCNPSKALKQGCYDGKKLQPPQGEPDRPLGNAACGGLALQVAASIGTQTCRAANISDSDARGRAETVSAEGQGRFFFASYLQAGIHTYLIRRQPSDVVADTELKPSADDWEPPIEIQGFDVRRFSTRVGVSTVHCSAFTKHWGHVAQTTGYRHQIIGIYCSDDENDVADDDLNQLLGSIEPTG